MKLLLHLIGKQLTNAWFNCFFTAIFLIFLSFVYYFWPDVWSTVDFIQFSYAIWSTIFWVWYCFSSMLWLISLSSPHPIPHRLAKSGRRLMLIFWRNGREKFKKLRNLRRLEVPPEFAWLEFVAELFVISV